MVEQIIIEAFAIVGAVITVAIFIARLTPTKQDDSFVEKARMFFEKVSDFFLPDRRK